MTNLDLQNFIIDKIKIEDGRVGYGKVYAEMVTRYL
jgi:hypothetical protein